MKRAIFYIVAVFILIVVPIALMAQEETTEDLRVGITTSRQILADVPITHFEDADTWDSHMAVDQGVILSMKRKGKPLELPDTDPNDGIENNYVLGVKVAFNMRSYASISLRPQRPIKIPGITKAITVWVCGRSFKHRLYCHLIDFKGTEMIIDMGLLDFAGWKKVSIAVPAAIEQEEYHWVNWRGVSFAGLSIRTDPEESYGVYYVYFDELRAITDVYQEEHRDEDNMEDGW
jgi:hypothetical protein